MSNKLDSACKLLEGIEVVKDEDEREGKVTKTFLRKVFEFLDEVESKEEFIISVGYMVARRKKKRETGKKEKEETKETDAIKFFKSLKECVEKKEGDWEKIKNELRDIMEYTIKIYTIKAELGEDLCTKR